MYGPPMMTRWVRVLRTVGGMVSSAFGCCEARTRLVMWGDFTKGRNMLGLRCVAKMAKEEMWWEQARSRGLAWRMEMESETMARFLMAAGGLEGEVKVLRRREAQERTMMVS